MTDRLSDLVCFYGLLERLEKKVGGQRTLVACDGRMNWPTRGVYFFFESGEERSDSGVGLRVVRVGTHALTAKSRTTLWNRLSQHKGVERTGAGNHRGSIFRLILGSAMKRREHRGDPLSWGIGSDIGQAARRLGTDRTTVRNEEICLEIAVSQYIRAMPFLWLAVEDAAGPESFRGLIERNAIALLSNFERDSLDPPSNGWLGQYSDRERVRLSGLWNNNHVEDRYDPGFLGIFEKMIEKSHSTLP